MYAYGTIASTVSVSPVAAGSIEFFDPSYSVWPGEIQRPPPPGRPAPRVVQPAGQRFAAGLALI